MESNYNKQLQEYFQPSGTPNIAFNVNDEDRVLSFIISVGSSFPSEISRKLFLRVEQVNAILTKLINNEFLTRLIPDRIYPQELIWCRQPEFEILGIYSYEDIVQRSWVIVTEKGFMYVVEKFHGEHRRANSAYLETYPNIKLSYDEAILKERNLEQIKISEEIMQRDEALREQGATD